MQDKTLPGEVKMQARLKRARAITEAWRSGGEVELKRELRELANEQGRADLAMAIDTLSLTKSLAQLENILNTLGLRLGVEPVEYH